MGVATHYWEDFSVGETFVTDGRTVTESMLDLFSGLTGDHSDVHSDEEVMRQGEFGGRIAHAILTLGVLQGLMWLTGYNRGTAIATLGWDQLKWPTPVRIGDTVRGEWTISGTRLSRSRTGAGIVEEECRLLNQRDEVVLSGTHVLMVRCRSIAGGEDL
jgi:acyl dehydratase